MILEYALTMWIEGKEAPSITANGYPTKEACTMAGELFKAADMTARKAKANYVIICRGTTPKAAADASKHQG
ncbi:hypothetical protein [Pseudomonas nitroreducens]|uniref:hypothetical protein n=1 Tax=Pseudomonas nitroreducens TaxID=46680 RepID=UPI003D2A5EA6